MVVSSSKKWENPKAQAFFKPLPVLCLLLAISCWEEQQSHIAKEHVCKDERKLWAFFTICYSDFIHSFIHSLM